MGILYERGSGVPSLLRNRQQGGQNPGPGAGFSNILLPVLVVGGVVLLVSIGLYFRRRLRREAAASTAATTTAAATPTAQVAARRRRNRRRASQISTKSLPAYMEEAGDEEVVLVSRQHELLPPVAENAVRPSMDSGDSSSGEHAGMPLLERDSHAMPFSNAGVSPSQAQLDSNSPTQHSSTVNLNDERGEAPAYFEVVAADAAPAVSGQSPPVPPPATGTPSVDSSNGIDQTHTRRQSRFRTLFNRNNEQTSATDLENGTTRTHQTSTSIGSLRSLSLYRTRSGESTDQNQSTIPLRNISAPIPHTLVRTEFTFPRTGPTEQQIKFLSSRESLGRFGLPYGDEARADPPSFDAVVGASSSRISLALGHGRSGSLASSVNIPSTDQTPSASTTNLRDTDSPPPETPSADIAIQRIGEPEDSETAQPILPDIITSLPATGHSRLPRRMSTIHSAVEPPDSLPTSPRDRTSRQRLSTASASNRASLTA